MSVDRFMRKVFNPKSPRFCPELWISNLFVNSMFPFYTLVKVIAKILINLTRDDREFSQKPKFLEFFKFIMGQ